MVVFTIVTRNSYSKNCTILSFGIGQDVSFDLEMIHTYNANVFGFDPTPKSIKWVRDNVKTNNYTHYSYGISDKDELSVFYLPNNSSYVSGSVLKHKDVDQRKITVPMKCIHSIIKDIKLDKISIIKMDIEGSEFQVIPSILDSKLSFDQLCVEVHWRFFPDGFIKLIRLIQEINHKGYYIAYYSKNFEFYKGKKTEVK